MAAERGLILVDTKYEFGFDESGAIVLADEIHTPDRAATGSPTAMPPDSPPASARKLRQGFRPPLGHRRCDPYKDPIPAIPEEVILKAAAIYVSAYEKITGSRFPLPDPSVPPLTRVRENLREYFGKAA